MQPEFWHERWMEGRIGFHEGRANVFLVRHGALLAPPSTVLVPLAGKAHDLLHLAAKGHTVLGVELSAQAVEAFFRENGFEAERGAVGPFETWSSGPITMFVGDFFDLRVEHLPGPVGALYDRAAIVALPSTMRAQYAARVRALMPEGSVGLVVTFDYPQDLMSGPPFAVSGAELKALYDGLTVEELDSAMGDAPRLRELGVAGIERCYSLGF